MSANRCLLACLLVLLSSPRLLAETNRPNVVWICSDDHAAYVTGAYGNTQVRTPHIDRLAKSGMRFDRAYCNAPVCTASRQSFLTGRYPRTIGVTLLRTPLPQDEITLAEMLKEAAYETASIGKMHFNSPLKHGFDLRIDHREHRLWLRKAGATSVDTNLDVLPRWRPFRDPARIWLNGFHRPFSSVDEEMPGTYFARQAAAYLKRKHDSPFFLMVSLYEPHSPFRFPVEFRDRHDPKTFDVPKVGPEDDRQIPAIFRDLSDADKQGIVASYYTSVEFMDRNVGIVLDALEKSGNAGNTLVVYTGDHGYMLGQHGRFEKHCSYEQAVRSPLLVRWPDHLKPNSSTRAFVEFIDIVPTVLDVCGVRIPKNVQGKSLVRLLKGEVNAHRRRVFVEYAQNDEIMVRDENFKFVFERGKRRRTDGYDPGGPLPGHTFKLFDIKNDPAEMHNLAQSPQFKRRVDEYIKLLVDHLKKTARRPELIPKTDDPPAVLDFCVQPRDVTGPTGKKKP